MTIVPVDVQISVLPPDAATFTGQSIIFTELLQKLETADLQLTASKELVTLPTGLVGAVETKLLAFSGGILKQAPALDSLLQVSRSGILASSAVYTTILSVAGPGVLETLDFSTDYNLTDFQLLIDNKHLFLLARGGTSTQPLVPERLNHLNGENSIWKENIYDTENNYYHIHLKRPLQYNATLGVNVRQQSGVDKNVAAMITYRSIG